MSQSAEDANPDDELYVILDDGANPPPRSNAFKPGNRAGAGGRRYPAAEVEQHTKACLEQFQSGKSSWQVAQWGQEGQGWSHSHTWTVIRRARNLLQEVTRETAAEARARMLAMLERLLPECTEHVTGTAPRNEDGSGGGTVLMRHPDTGELLVRINHHAIQGYLGLLLKLFGLDKTVIEHRGLGSKRPAEMTNDELDAELERVEAELAKRATPPEGKSRADGIEPKRDDSDQAGL